MHVWHVKTLNDDILQTIWCFIGCVDLEYNNTTILNKIIFFSIKIKTTCTGVGKKNYVDEFSGKKLLSATMTWQRVQYYQYLLLWNYSLIRCIIITIKYSKKRQLSHNTQKLYLCTKISNKNVLSILFKKWKKLIYYKQLKRRIK